MNRSLAFALILLTACGDDGATKQPDAAVSDGAVTPVPQALVVTGDYDATGVLTKLDLTTLEVMQNIGGTGAVSGDPVIRHFGNRIYVINRLSSNNITVFDAATLAFVDQFSTGVGSNPQDVAAYGTALYVPGFETKGVVRVDTVDGTTSLIDLSSLDPDDMNPDCVSAYTVGDKVYVSCSILDRDTFTARGPGKVAVINTATNTLESTVTLPTANPYNFIERAPMGTVFAGDLLIPLLPSFTDFTTGCIARLTPGETTATCAAGLENSALGGTVVHMDISADHKLLWMSVSTVDENFENPTGSLKGFDLKTGELWAAAISPTTQLVTDVATCPDGSVVVVDKTMNAAGLRVYRENVEVTTAALPIGMPPTFGNALICYDATNP